METTIALTVNEEAYEVIVRPHWTLVDVLRDRLALTGTKKGCDSGACGCCTVLIDGEPAVGCMTLAIRCAGRRVTTVEGLARDGQLDPLQEAAIEHGAVQCGFCTPGWLLSAKALLGRNRAPTREDVRAAISGNLCRCTGYRKIEDAILAAAARAR